MDNLHLKKPEGGLVKELLLWLQGTITRTLFEILVRKQQTTPHESNLILPFI